MESNKLDPNLSPHLQVHEVSVRVNNKFDKKTNKPIELTFLHGYEQDPSGHVKTSPKTGEIYPTNEHVEILSTKRVK